MHLTGAVGTVWKIVVEEVHHFSHDCVDCRGNANNKGDMDPLDGVVTGEVDGDDDDSIVDSIARDDGGIVNNRCSI